MPFDHWIIAQGNHDSAVRFAEPPATLPTGPLWSVDVSTSHSSATAYRVAFLAKSFEDMERTLFDQAVNEWLVETQWLSSVTSITRHPQFGAIKRMGKRAIKFILERMAKGEIHVHWFPLLRDLSGANPVPPEKRGIVREMAEEWVRWGRANGHLNA